MKYPRRGALVCVALAGAFLAVWPSLALADGAAWEQWQSVPGIVDVGGPRSDGSFVVAGAGALYLMDQQGVLTPFARGPGGYREDVGLETYLAVSGGAHVESANCDFAPDETFILRLHTPFGINRVSAGGDDSGSFVNIPGATTLTGITFDTGGSFDHRLLVLGLKGAHAFVDAVDCNGGVRTIAASLPVLEGGMEVAPSSFGAFGGDLVIPDESGRVLALAADGKLRVIIHKPLPAGVDATLGGLGFVPDGFTSRGTFVYHADHRTPGSTSPGTDSLLRLTANEVASAGVHDGDLLVGAEDGGALINVHCEQACTAVRIVGGTKAHVEGHFAFTMAAPQPPPSPVAATRPLVPAAAVDFAGQWGVAIAILVAGVVLAAAVGARALRRPR